MAEIDRRQFLITTAAIGGGMALSLHLGGAEAAEASALSRVNPRPWLQPAEGGVEIGSSSLPMIALLSASISRSSARV